MQYIDITEENLHFVDSVCLDPSVPEKWKKAMLPCMEQRRAWIRAMMREGLGIILAIGPRGSKSGLIEYVPIQYSLEPVRGDSSLFIDCIWVIPPVWKSGVGQELLNHCIEKAKVSGGLTTLAFEEDKWFGYFPYMPSSFFKKFGFVEVDRDETRVLLHLNLGSGDEPTLIQPRVTHNSSTEENLVEVLFNSQCPWSGWMVEKVTRALKKYDTTVRVINTDDRATIEEYGLSRGVRINGVPVIKRMATVKEVECAVGAIIPRKARKSKRE